MQLYGIFPGRTSFLACGVGVAGSPSDQHEKDPKNTSLLWPGGEATVQQQVTTSVSNASREDIMTDQYKEEHTIRSTSVMDKAWEVVSQVLSLIEEVKNEYFQNGKCNPLDDSSNVHKISAVATDDLFSQAHALLTLQDEFRLAGKPITVDLGFHFTREENLARIRTDGLLTKADRDALNILSKYNGSKYGDGIYTADDYSLGVHGQYGDVGIIVARLHGDPNIDCHVVKANSKVLVLKQSSQCLALMQFPRSLSASSILLDLQDALARMVDQYINQAQRAGETMTVDDSFTPETIALKKPLLPPPFTKKVIQYTAPEDVTILDRNGLLKIAKDKKWCFFVRIVWHDIHPPPAVMVDPSVITRMPSGTMSLTYSRNIRCRGHESVGTYVIKYMIPSAIQKAYHENPGQFHGSAARTAYIPGTLEGSNLLKRLQCAFQHGATFKVGTSVTSGKGHQVTWASIPHKTSLTGGEYGFPDPFYIGDCNEALDKLGIPVADML